MRSSWSWDVPQHLSNATLWQVDVGVRSTAEGTIFDGASIRDTWFRSSRNASFGGADVMASQLGGVTDADFTDADLTATQFEFTEPPTLAGAVLEDASLTVLWDGSDGYVMTLTDLDLTGVEVRASPEAEEAGVLLVVMSLGGSTLDGATFKGVDLSTVHQRWSGGQPPTAGDDDHHVEQRHT